MPAYAYAINIEYGKKEIKTDISVEVTENMLDANGRWSIDKLKEVVGDNPFYFFTEEENFSTTDYVVYTTTRLETDEEQRVRIESEEAYMEKYREQKVKREQELKERAQKIKNKGG